MLKRKPPTCRATRADGDPCKSNVLSEAGIKRLLEQGIHLVAAPEGLCSFHARSEQERRRMQSRGGKNSATVIREKKVAAEPVPDAMPVDIVLKGYALIRSLVDARIEGTFPAELDWRKASVGVYLASCFCAPPEDRAIFARSLLPERRHDIVETAEQELRETIRQLRPEEQAHAWEMIGAA